MTSAAKDFSAFYELRKQARDLPEMTMEEIDDEIRSARAEKRARLCRIVQRLILIDEIEGE